MRLVNASIWLSGTRYWREGSSWWFDGEDNPCPLAFPVRVEDRRIVDALNIIQEQKEQLAVLS